MPTQLTFDGEGPVGGAPSPGLSPHLLPGDGRGVSYLRSTSFEHPAYVLFDPRTRQHRELWGGPLCRRRLSHARRTRALVFAQTAPVPLPRRIGGNDSASWDDLVPPGPRRRANCASSPRAGGAPSARRIARSASASRVPPARCARARRNWPSSPSRAAAAEVLQHNTKGEIAYSPSWSPAWQADRWYSRFKLGGFHDIHLFDLATTHRPRPVDRSRAGHRATLFARTAGSSCGRRTAPASTTYSCVRGWPPAASSR